jgi:hypothetical protein
MKLLAKYALLLLFPAIGLVCESNPSNSGGGSIVCKDGEAWIEADNDDNVGYIFAEDGGLIAVAGNGGRKIGQYTVEGDKLTFIFTDAGYSATVTYKIKSGKLTLSNGEAALVYVKKTGVHVNA